MPAFKTWILGDATDLVQTILTLLFYGFATVVSLIFVLRPKMICHETLAAAAFAYLMLGITWGQAYQLIHLTVPNSFFVNVTNDLDKALTWTDFLYFSFATMTSTGYGDLTAVTSQSRSLASLEALVGQFYMAVVVARLVGIYQIAPMVGLWVENQFSRSRSPRYRLIHHLYPVYLKPADFFNASSWSNSLRASSDDLSSCFCHFVLLPSTHSA